MFTEFSHVQNLCEILLSLLFLETLYESSILFCYFCFYSSAIKQSPQAMTTSSSLSILMRVKSGRSTLQKRLSVKLLV